MRNGILGCRVRASGSNEGLCAEIAEILITYTHLSIPNRLRALRCAGPRSIHALPRIHGV